MAKMKKISIAAFGIILILLFSATMTGAVDVLNNIKKPQTLDVGNSGISKSWTIMFYFAGDHQRGKEIPYNQDILKNIGSTNEVNIIGLYDGKQAGDTFYCYIEKDLLVPLDWYDNFESNMAEPETLQKFLELTMYLYPADKYALFSLSAFGSGWQGIISDTHGTGSSTTVELITMPEISEVLKSVTNNGSEKIDIFCIDVCVGGNVEVAYEIAPYVDYMVANEEHGFGGPDELSDDGLPLEWNYTNFIQQIVDNPSMTPEEFAIYVAESYTPSDLTSKILGIFNPPSWYPIIKYYTDLSASNLGEIDFLKDAISNLGEVLTDNISECRGEIKKARAKTREYGKLYRKFWFIPWKIKFGLSIDRMGYDCFIDVYDFADKLYDETSKQYVKDACMQVMDAINTTVIANSALPDDPTNGLSMYFPQLRCQYDQSIWRGMGNRDFRKISSYTELKFSEDTNWNEFLEAYLRV